MEILGNIYYKYIHLVYGICLKYLKNRESAQDAVMRIFEKLTIEAIRQEIVHFKNWLYIVSKNYCLSELQKQNIEDERFKNWEEEEKQILKSGFEINPIDEASRISETLQNCLNTIDLPQKDCIQLFYFKRKSYREISSILKMDEKKVKSNIQNGKLNLKICLESKHE